MCLQLPVGHQLTARAHSHAELHSDVSSFLAGDGTVRNFLLIPAYGTRESRSHHLRSGLRLRSEEGLSGCCEDKNYELGLDHGIQRAGTIVPSLPG